MGFKEAHPGTLLFLVFIFWVSDMVGWLFVNILFIVPSAWRLSESIPVNPIILIIIPLSVFMLHKLFVSLNYLKNKVTHLTVFFILTYSSIILATASESFEGITFDIETIKVLSHFVFLISILISLEWIPSLKFSSERSVLDSVFFAASIMWLSPFIAELFIWTKWSIIGIAFERASHFTIGGAGTQDILFWPGLWAVSTMYYFQSLIRIPMIKRIIDRKLADS